MAKPTPSVDQRVAILESTRTLKMAKSAHAYVRGNTAGFYTWLADSPAARSVPSGPSVWICGDCHLGNLGPLAAGNGRVDVQIRDLDQAVIGNPAHDLIRLGLSLATAARGSDLPGVTTARMIEAVVEGYAAAIADPIRGDAGPEPDVVTRVRKRALGRRWRHLSRERLDGHPRVPLGRKFWALEDRERSALTALFEDPAVAELVLSLDHKDAGRAVHMVDAAYWMKGCSSLGLRRYAAIVELENAKGRADYALIDLKEAVAPIAPVAKDADMPRDNARRVVTAAQALSPNLGARMMPVRLLGRSLFLRELAPQDLKLEIDQLQPSEAVSAARYLAFVVGKAHARQMDDETRHDWARELNSDRRGMIDAPNWLWQSVASLAGAHETGYLEHCRRFALAA